jgi:hypothetical protein
MRKGMKGGIVLHSLNKYFSQWKYLLRGWSMMTSFIPFLIVTLLYEVFIEGMEYDDTFHTFSHCDLNAWSICWADGVWWHLSYLFSRCERCHSTPSLKYVLHTMRSQWEKEWKVASYSIPSINTSVSEVTMRKGMKGVIVLHHLNKYSHWQKYLLKEWSTMTPLIPFLIVTSWYEVFIERVE